MSREWKGFYADEAQHYHQRRYATWYGSIFRDLHQGVVRRLLASMDSKKLCLDCATGTGHTLEVLMSSGCQVIGSDLTFEMLQTAKQRAHTSRAASFVCCDVMALPFPDNSYDMVTSSRFLHLLSLSGQQNAIKEMARVLKPGGVLIVDFYNQSHWDILRLPVSIYRRLLRKRPMGDTFNDMAETTCWLSDLGLTIREQVGVGSYILVLLRWCPRRWVIKVGELFRSGWLASLAEQVVVVATKHG